MGSVRSRSSWEPLRTRQRVPRAYAIARALGVSQRAVVLASAESLGLQMDEPLSRLQQLIPAAADELDEQDEAVVLGVLRAFTRRAPVTTREERLDLIRQIRVIQQAVSDLGESDDRVAPLVGALLGDRPWNHTDADLVTAVKGILEDPQEETHDTKPVSVEDYTLAAHEPEHDFEREQEETEHEA